MRTTIAAQLEVAIAALVPWTAEPSERLRRFASEATRPRGVWCTHLASLRQAPEQALMLLEPLKADPAPYVQGLRCQLAERCEQRQATVGH